MGQPHIDSVQSPARRRDPRPCAPPTPGRSPAVHSRRRCAGPRRRRASGAARESRAIRPRRGQRRCWHGGLGDLEHVGQSNDVREAVQGDLSTSAPEATQGQNTPVRGASARLRRGFPAAWSGRGDQLNEMVLHRLPRADQVAHRRPSCRNTMSPCRVRSVGGCSG
jgi:hypothetical protein